MSELGDLFREWREYKQAHKAQRRATFYDKTRSELLQIFKDNGFNVTFIHKDIYSEHWRIKSVDYWAITGTWIDKTTGKRGRGINGLIKFLKLEVNK
jgi:hypothetical protein